VRIVFMGSPAFAVPALRWLASEYQVVGVVTQPDRPAGRGRQLVSPPVKTVALELGLPFVQPFRMREPSALDQLRQWQPDLIVVAAFGQILRPQVLQLPARGCVNLHASLLPRHRGAAPIPAAILAGDSQTGITMMRMDEGIDTGPILAQVMVDVAEHETGLTLTAKLAELAGATAKQYLPAYLRGDLPERPQPEEGATYAPLLRKEDGHLDFALPAQSLERRVRALSPWPGTFALWQNKALKILEARPLDHVDSIRRAPGIVFRHERGVAAACAQGALLLLQVQPPGKKAMTGEAFVRGSPHVLGSMLL
jgi:methionyl-tRNA formyltransferase